MEKEDTIINLKPNQAALVVDENFRTKVYMPGYDDDENVETHANYIVELGILTSINEDEFIDKILKGFYDRVELVMEEENEG